MTHEVIPDVAGLPRNIEYQLTEYGGTSASSAAR